MYSRRRAESGQGHPHFISFNQEIKALSSFKLSIHGRGPLIQLRFLREEKWGAGEWRGGMSAVHLHPYSAGTAFPPQQPGLSPACDLMCLPMRLTW